MKKALCPFCEPKEKLVLNGPIWADPLYDTDFVKSMLLELEEQEKVKQLKLATYKKIKGLLHAIIDEQDLREEPKTYNLERLFS